MPRTISLQVPPGAEAGDALTFVIEGKDMEIPIPSGSQPGDVLEIQVDAGSNDGDDGTQTEDSSVEIELVNGKTLQFATVLPPEAAATNDNKSEDKTSQDAVDDGTYAHPWPSGLAMATFWGSLAARKLVRSILSKVDSKEGSASTETLNVLELGSGLGLVGVSLAAQCTDIVDSSLPPIGKIVLSDVQDGMALLKHNVGRNSSSLQCSVETVPLLWTEDATKGEQPPIPNDKFDLILASDVLYNTESIPALVATLKRFLFDKSSLLLAVRWRKPDQERSFFEALEGWQGKRWRLVHTPNCPLSWKEYGNPKCEASNRYFHQTMVAVQGKPHSLAEILNSDGANTEVDNLQEQMTDQEAEMFENCHIQFYCLTSKKVGYFEGKSTGEVTTDEAGSRKRSREV